MVYPGFLWIAWNHRGRISFFGPGSRCFADGPSPSGHRLHFGEYCRLCAHCYTLLHPAQSISDWGCFFNRRHVHRRECAPNGRIYRRGGFSDSKQHSDIPAGRGRPDRLVCDNLLRSDNGPLANGLEGLQDEGQGDPFWLVRIGKDKEWRCRPNLSVYPTGKIHFLAANPQNVGTQHRKIR